MNLAEIKTNPNNPRLIKDARFKQLKKSIEDLPHMMVLRPIVVDETGTVLGGNMRLEALKSLGYKDVPDEWVKRTDELSEEQKKEFVIKDNAGFGEWDWDQLANEWSEYPLADWGVDVPEDWAASPTVEEDESAVAEMIDKAAELQKKWKVERGQIWEIGKHRLMCGDSASKDDVDALMNGANAQILYADPPYGMNLDTDWSGAKSSLQMVKDKGLKGGRKYAPVMGDDVDYDPNPLLALFPADECFLWGADYYAERIPNKNGGSWFVWDKRLDESADRMYGSCFELCWSKKAHKRDVARIKWAGVFGVEQEPDRQRYHPNQKPITLTKWFLERYSKEGDIVVSPYGGSGGDALACEQMSRVCLMMEGVPEYCAVTLERLSALGLKPKLTK